MIRMDIIFRAISDPTRRDILDLLTKDEKPVAELAKSFDISLPAVSQHLKVLQKANLVTTRRKGRQIIYQLNAAPLRQVSRWIQTYERFWKRI
jgi:DNA-binding transcriptional ArsR family regulator